MTGGRREKREAFLREAIATCASTPTGKILLDRFNQAAGTFQALNRIPTARGDYSQWSTKIRITPSVSASIVVHELRHHSQAEIFDKEFSPRGLRQDVYMDTFIEADARAFETLYHLEMLDLADEGKKQNIISRMRKRVWRWDIPKDSPLYKRLDELDALSGPVPRELKLQLMRDTFDGYVAACRNPRNYYRKKQMDMTAPVMRTGTVFFGMLYATAMLGHRLFTDPGAGLWSASFFPVMAMATLFIGATKISDTFEACAAPPPTWAGKTLARLGALPDGSGNYLTETQGRMLDDPFYLYIPPNVQKAIDERKADFRRGLIPFATTLHGIKKYLAQPA